MLRARDITHGLRGVSQALAWLPRGETLPLETWIQRHAGLRWLLWAQVPALVGLESLFGRHGATPVALFLVPVAILAAVAGAQAIGRRLQSVAVAVGLMHAGALAVYVTDGLTEMHFLFFVFVIALSLYEDWLIFGVAIGFVVLHHALAPALGLGHVYHHGGSAWPWALLHGAFVLAAASVCVVSWRLSEQVRAELVIAESRSREAQRLESLGLLAGGIAHDFNNLLVGVLGNASLALAELPESSPLRRYLEGIELAGTRAAELSKQMLAYAGRGRVGFADVDISRVVRDMAHLLDAGFATKGTIVLDLGDSVGLVRGDAGQLSQVVMNVITNGVEALGDDGGTVTVRTSTASAEELAASSVTGLDPARPYALIEVADTGSGMDEETLRGIFEPFFTTKFHGRGLGLAAVLGIVRSHAGVIDVSSAPGGGSTFRVFLPAAPAAVKAAPARAAAYPTRKRYTGLVLSVDDEGAVRDVVAAALQKAGFGVVSVSGGEEAAVRVANGDSAYSLAILDMTMPGLSGLETARRLRAIHPDLPIILSSGYSVDSVEDTDFSDFPFLQKPYDLAKLVALAGEVAGSEQRVLASAAR